ncbi:MAG: right-handed parallel beta-helix repeat-containing protein, partial [bacterium]
MKKLLALVVFGLSFLTQEARAADWYVNLGQSIQAAINGAASGDTIYVAAGTYNEAIYINKNIALIGAEAGVCTITASGISNTNTVTFDGGNAQGTITGFTITGASGWPYCYGIRCINSANPFIINSIILRNSGSGISCLYSSPIITNNTILENGWYGICCNHSSPQITNNTISRNLCSGIGCQNNDFPAITNNTISENGEHGICCHSFSSPFITNNIIARNGMTNNYFYGIYNVGPGNLTISYNNIWGNGLDGTNNYYNCFPGPNDISVDTQFIDSVFHLGFSSPCIDKGSNTYVPSWLTTMKEKDMEIQELSSINPEFEAEVILTLSKQEEIPFIENNEPINLTIKPNKTELSLNDELILNLSSDNPNLALMNISLEYDKHKLNLINEKDQFFLGTSGKTLIFKAISEELGQTIKIIPISARNKNNREIQAQ